MLLQCQRESVQIVVLVDNELSNAISMIDACFDVDLAKKLSTIMLVEVEQ
jgi:hypothetical protein